MNKINLITLCVLTAIGQNAMANGEQENNPVSMQVTKQADTGIQLSIGNNNAAINKKDNSPQSTGVAISIGNEVKTDAQGSLSIGIGNKLNLGSKQIAIGDFRYTKGAYPEPSKGTVSVGKTSLYQVGL